MIPSFLLAQLYVKGGLKNTEVEPGHGLTGTASLHAVKVLPESPAIGFRPQAFVTRAFVVPVSGVKQGQPVVEGVFTGDGRKTNCRSGEEHGERAVLHDLK